MSNADRTRSTKFLRLDHMKFEIVGKPALCVNHMQRGLAGEGMFISNWGPNAKKGIEASGMVEKCREKTYCKEVIDIAGKDGGYIMSAAAVMNGGDPQNVKSMFDFTRDYGVY